MCWGQTHPEYGVARYPPEMQWSRSAAPPGIGNPAVWWSSIAVWGGLALLAGTHQWSELRATGKELSWLQAFAWQGVSWLLLVPATPWLFAWIQQHPLDANRRILRHLGASLLFGVAFLVVSLPLRHALHPSPVRWEFFGEAFYKSAPQGVVLGTAVYWLVVGVASLREARGRLRRWVAAAEQQEVVSPAQATSSMAPVHLATAAGSLQLAAEDILWLQTSPLGARLHTADRESYLLRSSLAELERVLAPHGVVRIHRGYLVQVRAIREVIGAASREGTVRLHGGHELPLSRRRRPQLARALASRSAS